MEASEHLSVRTTESNRSLRAFAVGEAADLYNWKLDLYKGFASTGSQSAAVRKQLIAAENR